MAWAKEICIHHAQYVITAQNALIVWWLLTFDPHREQLLLAAFRRAMEIIQFYGVE
jgi:hypothetical protein